MEYRTLGTTGITVSRLAFGAMSFGGRADRRESANLYALARERGINLFDCANVYQRGTSEEILGSLIAAERERVVITTKAYSPMGDDPNERGSSSKNLTHSLHQSLKRLNTEYVDLFFLHGYDPFVSEEEILRTMERFVSQGKVLAFGVSNYSGWQTSRLLYIARMHNLPTVQCIQPMYSLAKRTAEIEILPMAHAEGIGVISYSPLGGGLLAGRHNPDAAEKSVRLDENPIYRARYGGEWYHQAASRFLIFAQERSMHPATLAVSWVLANPVITAPILGAANTKQLSPSLDALSYPLDSETLHVLDEIFAPPPPANDRTEISSQKDS
jgi:aryl-alcohol dehydrogenase-like predicted oxidoreductase